MNSNTKCKKICEYNNCFYLIYKKYDFIMCASCVNKYGKIKIPEIFDECGICYLNNKLIKLQCDHMVCVDCWRILVLVYVRIVGMIIK